MPVAPLDTLESAVNMARVRVLDAGNGVDGGILRDGDPATLVAINAAWRRLQELLVDFGFSWFEPETVLVAVPAVASSDPASQVTILWTGFWDGASLTGAPVLPQDLIAPLLLWERKTGVGASFYPMDKLTSGLPGVPKKPFSNSWEWRNGAIYMPGATQSTDIRIRYAGASPDFAPATTTPFSAQPIPIVRAANALAWFICSEFAKPRGDMDAGDFDIKGQLAAQYIFNLDPTKARPAENEKVPIPPQATKGEIADANASVR